MSSRSLNALLSVVTVQLVLRHLVAFLPDQAADIAWNVADISRALGLSATLALCTILTPWRLLRVKSVCAALTGYYIVDLVTCTTWYAFHTPSPIITGVAQGVVVTAVVCVYWYRSYCQPSDTLIPGYVYCVRHIPTTGQDFAISLMGIFGPDGGYSIYIDGYMWKFAKGRLVCRKVSSIPMLAYHVTRGVPATDAVLRELNDALGMRWSIRYNCVTVLGRIWRRSLHGTPKII